MTVLATSNFLSSNRQISFTVGWEYKRSLRTKTPKEAKSRFAVELVKCEKVFADAPQGLSET